MEHVEQRSERPTCDVCGLVDVVEGGRSASRVIAESAAMQELLKRVARFADSDAPVVIFGESGTGKEIVARTLHASGPRSGRPLVAVNVAALPSELLESELFGHAKGAFTGAARAKHGLFEEANGGTLFLDEIGEMPLALQAKLLRALQDGEIRRVGDTRAFAVDARIVCATHRDLPELVRRGAFREDLFYRLKVFAVRVPSLRERRDDILPLARQFLGGERSKAASFDASSQRALLAHDWPGNVRELQNAVKHGAALARGRLIEVHDLPDEVRGIARPARVTSMRTLAEIEREHIESVLAACGGSQSDAARVLGIARNTLWRKLRA
jgi:DNA-binding NtrC family response regulator